MNPLLLLIPELIPQLVKLLEGDHSAGFQDQAIQAIEARTGHKDLTAAQAAINSNKQVKDDLTSDLEEIALAELKERNRAKEEAARIELELHRMEVDERDRQRAEDVEQQKRALQDREKARAMQGHLADEYNPLAWVAPILALALVVMIGYLLHGIMFAREPVINKDVFNVVLGALVTAFTTVIAYYFGSSLGSSKKDEALRNGTLVTGSKKDASQTPGDEAPTSSVPPTVEGASAKPGDQTGSQGRKTQASTPPSGRLGLFRQKAANVMRNLMRGLGLTEVQAAGILGNIGWECGSFQQLQEQNPIKGGRGGLGWCQWTASRRIDFEKWLAERNARFDDDDANYDFLLFELNGSQKPSVAALKRANSVESATSVFMDVFEKPAKKYAHLDKRVELANLALQEFRRG